MGNMNEAVDPSKSPIGQSVRRREDRRFITGAGTYTDDVVLHGQTFGVVLHGQGGRRCADPQGSLVTPLSLTLA